MNCVVFTFKKLYSDVTRVCYVFTAQKLYSDEPIDEKIVHQSQIKLMCLLCGKKSTSRGYIYNHVLRHGPPRLMCGYCSATMYFPKEAK